MGEDTSSALSPSSGEDAGPFPVPDPSIAAHLRARTSEAGPRGGDTSQGDAQGEGLAPEEDGRRADAAPETEVDALRRELEAFAPGRRALPERVPPEAGLRIALESGGRCADAAVRLELGEAVVVTVEVPGKGAKVWRGAVGTSGEVELTESGDGSGSPDSLVALTERARAEDAEPFSVMHDTEAEW